MNKGGNLDIWSTSPTGMMPMSRRSGGNVKIIVIVVVGLVFLTGLYWYHDVYSRLTRTEEKAERLRQQHDSLSAQLQVVYEHKSRLEKSLQQEKQDHRKTKEELTNDKRKSDSAFFQEKQELLNRVNTINQEHKMLQSQHEDTQNDLTRAQENVAKLQDDLKQLAEKNQQEYMQLKQERENEVALLRDEIANLKRRNEDLQSKLSSALQQSQFQQNLQPNIIPQMPQKGNLQQGVLPGQQQLLPGQQLLQGQQQQLLPGQQGVPAQQPGIQQQQGFQQQGYQQGILHQPVQGQLEQAQQNQGLQQQQKQQKDEHVMQVPVPGDNKPYFQPKEGQVDHEVGLKGQEADDGDADVHQVPAQHQVAAPAIPQDKDDENDSRFKKVLFSASKHVLDKKHNSGTSNKTKNIKNHASEKKKKVPTATLR